MSLRARVSGKPASRTRLPAILVAFVALASFSFVAMPAAAHESANHGTIKVHDEMTAEPPQRNEPHVDCEDFWVEGFGVSDDEGRLVFISWAPTGDNEIALMADWEGEESTREGRFDFLAGPFNLPAGHYRVEAYMESGHPGNEPHFAKAKMFWVEPCGDTPETPPENLACPAGLRAEVNPERGGFILSWTPAEGSDGTNVYRAVEDGDFELIETVPEGVDAYHDADVEMHVTYTYMVTALFGDRESTNCEEVEITAIPNFPTVVALIGAAILGTAGYAFATRRHR